MSYHVVDIDSIAPHPDHESDRRTLQGVLDLEHVGVSLYTAAPGEQVPQRYHYHDTQEELFYVIAGRMSVETPDGEYHVGENELFLAEPGAPHRAFNADDAAEPLRVLAIGAPVVADGHAYPDDDR
ncbi:cupin domain-containing protein [Halomarina oriensis]|uniref:Cupin domain-containing protein n=1 Tax=Halomarina oriensis TaxID=671145 RepID=A0A6B0GPG0_9EURY|nr:cupin domain-containing protein [Halomarina oriensis]MWG33508.1 cupin domain-containing protein [Halomarina oriensis]